MKHLVLASGTFARSQDRRLRSDPVTAGRTNQSVMPVKKSGDTKSAGDKQDEVDANPGEFRPIMNIKPVLEPCADTQGEVNQ